MKRFLALIVLFYCFSFLGFSQSKFVIQNKTQSDKIKFKLINNLIVLPVEVNGVNLSFLLDTGVSKPIIFNFLNVSDTLKIRDTETIHLRGLGNGETVEALRSRNNVFKIGEAVKLKQDLYAVFNSNLNFGLKLGVPVHGIIGLDIFKDFIVEINYSSKYLKLTIPKKFKYKKCKKCERFNLEFYNGKPYIYAEVNLGKKNIPVKLLIDSGGSDALWLFEDDSLGIRAGDKFFNDFLGHGLSGSVYGKRSKVKTFSLKSFVLKNANVAFPDSTSVLLAKKIKDRNGSLSGNILKRFNIIFDYQKAILKLKKNNHFKEKFSYNKSGIELEHDGVRLVKEIDKNRLRNNDIPLVDNGTQNSTKIIIDPEYKISLKPAYTIVELREGSPAEESGLKIGDVILSINNKQAHEYSLQEIVEMFYDDAGKRMKLKIDRNGLVSTFYFQLQKLF
ncbi:signaling protein [Flavivirga aquatica]|uniref:Signaling protein n=1 Tax=Flavivirga aquatica TaxID=1849968 RepID=A0A1E5TC79_9FLAO|nr:aspartyl protease family protein [Flavivirga aquatica]OEK09003.1 signaling protein [Flavivirga aquatica]